MTIKCHHEIDQYLADNEQTLIDLIETLCKIPAPSNHEQQRAAFIKDWLAERGALGVYIDDAFNVVYPAANEEKSELCVLMAHMDTVFPDKTPFEALYDGNRMRCPGVGDNTANLAMLLLSIAYVLKHRLRPSCGVLFVADAGEEGLGNLKGCRQIMQAYAGRVKQVVALDGSSLFITNRAVGSKRYRVTVKTEGGHSFSAFGNRNAIHILSSMINTLYTLKTPPEGKSAYNVGTISGGTSVNTIAQQAEMLYEFRSDHKGSLDQIEAFFRSVLETYRAMGASVTAELVGDRPCMGDVDPKQQAALEQSIAALTKGITGLEPSGRSGSTDCNIPLSLGIPAVSFGGYTGYGAHTREEYIHLDSLKPGFRLLLTYVLSHFD